MHKSRSVRVRVRVRICVRICVCVRVYSVSGKDFIDCKHLMHGTHIVHHIVGESTQ